jgi:hypothetical protein
VRRFGKLRIKADFNLSGNLGLEPKRTEASVVVRVTWSEESISPRTSADILSNLVPWLHDWLHGFGSGVSSAVQIVGSDGVKVEILVEIPSF